MGQLVNSVGCSTAELTVKDRVLLLLQLTFGVLGVGLLFLAHVALDLSRDVVLTGWNVSKPTPDHVEWVHEVLVTYLLARLAAPP